MAGEQQSVDWGVFPLMGNDALYVRWNGGGGYGDPLLRPPEEVGRDVRNGLTSTEFAETVYGVVMDAGTGEPDPLLTDQKKGCPAGAEKKRSGTRSGHKRACLLQTLRTGISRYGQ